MLAPVLALVVLSQTAPPLGPAPQSEAKAEAPPELDCKSDKGEKCAKEAFDALFGGKTAEDRTRGRALFERACEAGNGNGCLGLAMNPYFGLVYSSDLRERQRQSREALEHSAVLYAKACEFGQEGACYVSAKGSFFGIDGFPLNLRHHALPLLKRVCESEKPAADPSVARQRGQACSLLATAYRAGMGIELSRPAAIDYYTRACKLMKQEPCDALLEMHAETMPCRNSTRLTLGLTKASVAKLLGDPTLSQMDTCGGAKGVKRWPCETVSYRCALEDGQDAVAKVIYGFNLASSWSVEQPMPTGSP